MVNPSTQEINSRIGVQNIPTFPILEPDLSHFAVMKDL